MTNTPGEFDTPADQSSGPKSDLLGSDLSEAERTAAFQAGHAPVPPRFILLVSVAIVVVVAIGTLIEHFFGNTGASNPPTGYSVTTSPSTTPTLPGGPQLSASVKDLLGLHQIATAPAPNFTLTDQSKQPWSLDAQRGSVVVLTFFDARCQDICPVLGQELAQARTLLTAQGAHVTFAVVNTNPHATTPTNDPTALSRFGLSTMPNVYFLNGPLSALNHVWVNYGVQIRVDAKGHVAHNEVIYFITPEGKLSELAIPFGNESSSGVFTLRAKKIHDYAVGVAQTASSLEHS
ncbi:MAG TPA: SCO family protein [Acidimicrobiales bacterium]|nr:SCO family protein [Acidimicrobiales bacterium]